MSRTRLAILGLNHYHVTGWAETLTHLPQTVEVVALYDPDSARRATLAPDFYDPSLPARLGDVYRDVPFYTDWESMLQESRPDAALVMMQNRDAPGAIAALARAGVHAFVDKPGARTAADLAAAMRVANAAGVTVGTGLMWRYNPLGRQVRDLVQSGKLGTVLGAEATLLTSTVKQRDPENLLFDIGLSGGGVLHWLGVHRIDSLRFMTGQEIVAVQAMTANAGGQPVAVEDTAAVAFQMENGAIGMLYAGYHLPLWTTTGYVAVHGTELSASLGMRSLTLTDRERTVETPAPAPQGPPVSGYGGASGVTAIGDWLDAAAKRREPVSTGNDLVRALAVIDAVYESAQSGRRVDVVRYG